jgi:outer membrane protein
MTFYGLCLVGLASAQHKIVCWAKAQPTIAFILWLTLSHLSHATDLMDVYQDALANDNIFKAAFSTYMATTEAVPQAQSALLPQVTLNGQVGKAHDELNAGIFNINSTYGYKQWQVNASQAIFNYQAWKSVAQAKNNVKAAQAKFNSAAQDLMLRVTSFYLDALLAQDTLNFEEAKKRANKKQLDQASERFKVGLDAITSVYEAQAAYDQSIADVIAAKNNLINRNEDLRKLTNHVYEQLAPLRDSKIPLLRPEPQNVDEWVNTGLKQNYPLLAAKYSLEAARENIKVKSSGNWPVFSVQGNSTRIENTGGTNTFLIPDNSSSSQILLAVNFPIYQGGLVASQTRQAKYNYQTSNEQLEQAYREVVVNSRIAYNTIIDGISKVKADRQTIVSRVNQVDSTSAQFEVGTRTMVDVTNAQQRLFEAQEQLASDQYRFIKAELQLKNLAGTLSANDLEEVNSWLATTRLNHYAPTHALR